MTQKAASFGLGQMHPSTAIAGRRFTRVRGLTLIYWRSYCVFNRGVEGNEKGVSAPRPVCTCEDK
jgi:hypothetical protein